MRSSTAQLVNNRRWMRPIRSRKRRTSKVRGQTGEGVSHCVRSAKPKMVAAAFCAMSFAQQAGIAGCGWGYNNNHAHLVCGCARSSHKRTPCQCLFACGRVRFTPDYLKTGDAGTPSAARHILSHGIFPEMRIFRAPVSPSWCADREIESIDDARMGLAVLWTRKLSQLSGLRCDVCYRECPKIDEAITLS